MAYSPELSQAQSGALRRIAWALEMPMTKAMGEILEYVSKTVAKERVCNACKDKSFCDQCPFK